METKRFEYFLRTVETGTISSAARELGMSQPALSQQLAILENEMKAELLFRSPNGSRPTPAGEQLYRRARVLLRQLDEARAAVMEAREVLAGAVTVGFPTSVATAISLPFVRTMTTQYPQIQLKLVEGYSAMLTEMMQAGHLDLALLFQNEPLAGVKVEPLWREELLLVGPAETAAPRNVTLEELGDFPLLLPSKANSGRIAVDQSLAMNRLTLAPLCEIDSIVTLKKAVASGVGYTILPWTAVSEEVEAGQLSVSNLAGGTVYRVVSLCILRNAPFSLAMRKTVDLIRDLATSSNRRASNVGIVSLLMAPGPRS